MAIHSEPRSDGLEVVEHVSPNKNMRHDWDYRTPGEQILSGIFIFFWLLSRPFIWMYRLLYWLTIGIVKEAGNKIVKVVGGAIGLAVVAFLTSLLFHQ